jgi:Holliday junction DNA helicase RuvA
MLGFLRADDKDFFDLFTTVKGIGTKKALKAFAIPTAQIAAAIALKDTRKLSSLPTIGKRAAEQIIAELHGKVEKFAVGAAPSVPVESLPDHQQSAIAALITLGEKRNEAENWVRRVCEVDASLKDPNKIVPAVYRLKNGGR